MVSLSIIPSRRKARFLTATIERIPEAANKRLPAGFLIVSICADMVSYPTTQK
jgi:hypothetical protein